MLGYIFTANVNGAGVEMILWVKVWKIKVLWSGNVWIKSSLSKRERCSGADKGNAWHRTVFQLHYNQLVDGGWYAGPGAEPHHDPVVQAVGMFRDILSLGEMMEPFFMQMARVLHQKRSKVQDMLMKKQTEALRKNEWWQMNRENTVRRFNMEEWRKEW